jgi:hypothetical protein
MNVTPKQPPMSGAKHGSRAASEKVRVPEQIAMPNRDEWLLLALARLEGKAMTPIQIQKTMFLLSEGAGANVGRRFYRFRPHNYGPFDANIYHDLEQLIARQEVATDQDPSRRWSTYAITALGMRRAATIRRAADEKTVGYMEKLVDWVTSLSFRDLLRAIYSKYPAYKVNSIFND